MCTLSFVILRNARKKPDIASLLQQFCSSVGCGVNFDSTGALQELPFLVIQQEDLAFEIYDRHSLINSGIFMSLDMPLRTNTPPQDPPGDLLLHCAAGVHALPALGGVGRVLLDQQPCFGGRFHGTRCPCEYIGLVSESAVCPSAGLVLFRPRPAPVCDANE